MLRKLAIVGALAMMPACTEAPDLTKYVGVYRGIAPTDESAIAHGELEVTISANKVVMRMATGLKVHEEALPVSELVVATAADVASQYKPGSPIPARTSGLRVKKGVIFLFIENPTDDEHGLIIRGNEMADILGLTILFSPDQVKRGLFDKWMDTIKKEAGDVLPRLANNGRAAGR